MIESHYGYLKDYRKFIYNSPGIFLIGITGAFLLAHEAYTRKTKEIKKLRWTHAREPSAGKKFTASVKVLGKILTN